MYGIGSFATASYGTQGVGLPVLSVETLAATSVTGYTATLNGEITDLGFDELEVTERGFIYGTASDGGNPGTYSYGEIVQEGSFDLGAFSGNVDGDDLDPDTTYYYRAYAINEDGIKYGDEVSFITVEVPTVDTKPVVNIKAFTAVGVLEITDIGDAAVTSIGFVFDTETQSDPNEEANPTPATSGYDDYVQYSGSYSLAEYAKILSGLTPNTTYYVRGFARNSGGYSFGDEVSFTTTYAIPVIESVSPAGLIVDDEETSITITGQYFRAGATVEVDGVTCDNIVVVNENTITCDAPLSAVAKESVLTVINDDDAEDSIDFFYIASVSPTPQPASVSATFTVKGVGVLK